jgi:6-phosphogluconate dehydrogenase
MVSRIGIIGLGVMGGSMAQNFAHKAVRCSVFNRTYNKTTDLIKKTPNHLIGFETIEKFVESLESPKKILLFVNSGSAVDTILETLKPLLNKTDIVVDCGNSNWLDTAKRQQTYLNFFHLVGCGISGGKTGALNGPSIMPSGDIESVENLLPILKQVAAKDFAGNRCVTNIGKGESGHFVKMVHNGIEYAIMQGIAEIYDILKYRGVGNLEIQNIFRGFNQGNTQSYLLDITVDILGKKDNFGTGYLLDRIKDSAKSKGTGAWSVSAGLEYGVAIPTIAAAVFARLESSRNQSFIRNLDIDLQDDTHKDLVVEKTISHSTKESLYRTLELIFVTSYLQGLDLIAQANKTNKWGVEIKEVIRVWQGGCIIRSQMLGSLYMYFDNDKTLKVNLLHEIYHNLDHLKLISHKSLTAKPIIHSIQDYYEVMFAKSLPTNLIQAQRDYFGSHGYERTDKNGVFSGGWE